MVKISPLHPETGCRELVVSSKTTEIFTWLYMTKKEDIHILILFQIIFIKDDINITS